MSQKQGRKRGANYTQEEKSLLLDLIAEYKHIVENKRTGSIYIQKKKEVWNAISLKYNSNCTSGPRDTEHLKALYDNMKQKSRKDVGESNKLSYISATQQLEMVTENDVTLALSNVNADKKEMQKTGGGFWKSKTTDNDAKVLSIIQDQVAPLCNVYDSASVFFKDKPIIISGNNQDLTLFKEVINDNKITGPEGAIQSCEPIHEITDEAVGVTLVWDQQLPNNDSAMADVINIEKEISSNKHLKRKNAFKQKKTIKTSSTEALKRIYFKKKCQNANLERKKLMLEILHLKREHNLRIELLKNKINNYK